jgi:hypothetical protein
MERRRFVEVLSLGLMATTLAASQTEGDAQDRMHGREHHPKIRAAIRALQDAKEELQHADTDFGGHRAEALEAVNTALKQLQKALRFDKR